MNQKQLANLLRHIQEGVGDLLKKAEAGDLELLAKALMEQPERSLKDLAKVISEPVVSSPPKQKSSSRSSKAKVDLPGLKEVWEDFDRIVRTTFEGFEQAARDKFNGYTKDMLLTFFWGGEGFPISGMTKKKVIDQMINQLKSIRDDLQRAENVRLAATR